jgi:hypothetical protein
VRSTAAPYTESRLTHLVRNKCVGFPVVEQMYVLGCTSMFLLFEENLHDMLPCNDQTDKCFVYFQEATR